MSEDRQRIALADRTALVTGGSGGIGRAVVATLLGAGARVFSLDRPGAAVPSGATGIACEARILPSDEQPTTACRDRQGAK